MFDESSVIILGAGASCPFRYPIGGDLIGNIIDGLRGVNFYDDDSIPNRPEAFFNAPYRYLVRQVFERHPTGLPIEYLNSERPWRDLAERLHHSPSGSIDDFARDHPSLSKVIKLLVATEITRWSFDEAPQHGALVPWQGLTAGARNNWYGKFVARLKRQFPTPNALADKDITIITFNYDRSLETFLDLIWNRSEIFAKSDWRDILNIIHVHGEVQPLPTGTSTFRGIGDAIFSSCGSLLMISDERPAQDVALSAQSALKNADSVVTLGFDFHQSNIELLKLDEYGGECHALNFANSLGFSRRVEDCGFAPNTIWTKGTPYQIASAIEDGIFDF